MSDKLITLFLMTSKGYRVLKTLVENKLHTAIDAVIVGSDPKINNDFASEIHALCQQNKITARNRKDIGTITSPYAMAVSWQWMLNIPDTKLITLHDSLLPRYRGFAPLVNQLIKGEREIGATALLANDEFDRGPIIDQQRRAITYPIKIREAIQIVEQMYAVLTEHIVQQLISGKSLTETPQDETLATYSVWRDEEDYRINWSLDASTIRRFVDAVGDPYAGALTFADGKAIRILATNEVPDVYVENRDPGKVLFVRNNKPVVICGKGLLEICEAVDDTNTSVLPFTRFRLRFK